MLLPEATLREVLAAGPAAWTQASAGASAGAGTPLTLDALSAALYHAAGLTRAVTLQHEEFSYRACPSAGALYPCELYVFWPGADLLAAGLYHFDPSRHELVQLRLGRADAGALGLPAASGFPGEALVFGSAIFFRSAWKYQARAYRYLNLDCGHVTEGLCLGLAAHGVTHRVELDFDDAAVNAYLGVDAAREGCLAVIRVAAGAEEAAHPLDASVMPGQPALSGQPGQPCQPGRLDQPERPGEAEQGGEPGQPGWMERAGQGASPPSGPLPEGVAALSRMAAADALPEALARMHQAACVGERYSGGLPSARLSRLAGQRGWIEPPQGPGPVERLGLCAAMAARRSRRNFVVSPLPRGCLAKVLADLCAPLSPGAPGAAASPFSGPDVNPVERACRVGFLAGEEVHLAQGFYLLDRETGAIAFCRPGNLRPAMAGVCLDQAWMRNAALQVCFFADLPELERNLGPRGYRVALQAAGRLGHRLYLAAESLGLGACGVGAFYDAEAAEVLALPQGVALLYVLALGACKGGEGF